MARQPRRLRRTRPPQRNPPAPPAVRTRQHRAGGAADPPLPPHRRAGELRTPRPGIDRVILAGFVPGLSTRRISEVLPPLPGRPTPPATIGRVAGTLDAAVSAFHRRRPTDRCKALMPVATRTLHDEFRRDPTLPILSDDDVFVRGCGSASSRANTATGAATCCSARAIRRRGS